jgi:putative spermidine/putrescine transport system ATP-binding protein
VRPESLRLEPDRDGNASVVSVSFLGSLSRVHCALDGASADLLVQVSSGVGASLAPGHRVRLTAAPDPVLVVAP